MINQDIKFSINLQKLRLGLVLIFVFITSISNAFFHGQTIHGYQLNTCLKHNCLSLKSKKASIGRLFNGQAFGESTLVIKNKSTNKEQIFKNYEMLYDLDLNKLFFKTGSLENPLSEYIFDLNTEVIREF